MNPTDQYPIYYYFKRGGKEYVTAIPVTDSTVEATKAAISKEKNFVRWTSCPTCPEETPQK